MAFLEIVDVKGNEFGITLFSSIYKELTRKIKLYEPMVATLKIGVYNGKRNFMMTKKIINL